jgi:hypothetical protein
MYHLPILIELYIGVDEMPRDNTWGEDSGLFATDDNCKAKHFCEASLALTMKVTELAFRYLQM